MGSVSYTQAIRPDTGKLRKLIENSLRFDWIIRIEYASGECDATGWQQWGKTFFAIRSAEAILIAVTDCYQNNTDCTIRINAEKIRPQTRMLYTIYQPRYRFTDVAFQRRQSAQEYAYKGSEDFVGHLEGSPRLA